MMKLNNKFQNSNYNLRSNKDKSDGTQEKYNVFGKDLRLLVEFQQLPDLICMLGYIIKKHGLLSQGLFRISGNKTRIDELRICYSQSRRLEVGIDDIHNVTGLFKSFLREVPGGVVPCPQSLDLIKATKMYRRHENLDVITDELLKLPVPHYNLLKFTCSLLNHVSKYSAANLMTADNLGTVFGPTFFSSVEDMSLLSIANSTSAILIQNYNTLFKVSAPVHTNLSQMTENNQPFDVNANSANGSLDKNSAEHNTTIKFGDSCLLFKLNGETDNSLQLFSMKNEDLTHYPESADSGRPNGFLSTQTQFSNSLDMALRLCLTNHLFGQCQESDFTNAESIGSPRLISDVMFNVHTAQVHNNQHKVKQMSSNVPMKNIGKQRTVEEFTTSSLPRAETSANVLQTCITNQTRDPSDVLMKNGLNCERPVQLVPQLDLSVLYDAPEKPQSTPESKKQDAVKYNSKKWCTNNTQNLEPKINDSPLNRIKRNITNLKRQLRLFEDEYLSANGIRPDKSVKANDEWYSRSIIELKLLRQQKEQLMNEIEKTDDFESESIGNMKKKLCNAGSDTVDYRSNSSLTSDNRSALSRPVSALSEIAVRMTPSNESGRTNTLNSTATTAILTPDLSQPELESLKSALAKISDHLRAERIRDSRPSDLDSMTQLQIETEKVSMQKALLNFESTYGRKKAPSAVNLMRPLYDRYRQVKKRLCQLNDTLGPGWKNVHRTLDSHLKTGPSQSAWTNDSPVSHGLQSFSRGNIPQSNNRVVYLPATSQFDIDEDSVPEGQRRSGTIDNKSKGRNVRTVQLRRTSLDPSSDVSYNRRKLAQMEDSRSELQQLVEEKRELQRILKDFENNIERDSERKVDKLDRVPMEREYHRYKIIKTRIKELERSSASHPS